MGRRPYVRPVNQFTWWMKSSRYLDYMSHEITSIFVGAYALVLAIGAWRLAEGAVAWHAFLDGLLSPIGVAFQVVCLLLALWHTVTWFKTVPQAMPLMLGEEKVPARIIIAAHYCAWAIASALVILFVVGA